MNEMEKLNERINMIEGRCEYLVIVLSSLVLEWQDKAALLRVLESLSLSNDAAMLYSDSPITKSKDAVSRSLGQLAESLRSRPD